MEKKGDVINDLAARSGHSKAIVEDVLVALGESVEANIGTSEKYYLGSLGKLVLRETSARQGRNPQTGEAISIAAKKNLGLRPSKSIKDALNP